MSEVVNVSVHQAAQMAAQGATMLDVREPVEWQDQHLAGAVHLPLSEVTPTSVPFGTPVVVVCRSGNRSGQAASLLAAAGHDVVNMDGGMLAWNEAGLALTITGEAPTAG